MKSAFLCLATAIAQSRSYVPNLPEVTVYEANLRALAPQVGFDGLRARLSNIKALGINVLWLMPIQPVGKTRSAGGLGSPYAVADFRAINPEFGNAASLSRMVRAAHKIHLAVIMDWVADHTSWDNPWTRSHPDWYLHTPSGEISIPTGTNWNDVAGLDYSNPAMRAAMIAAMKEWVSRFDIDGFRCDAADRMPRDFWKSAIAALRAATPKHLLMLAEGFSAGDYAEGFDLTYGWDFCNRLRKVFAGGPATEIAAAASNEAKDLPKGARRLRFVTNHDLSAWEGSPREFYMTDQGSRTAFTIAALYGGTPLVYAGQEVDWPKRIPIFEESTIDWTQHPETSAWIGRLLEFRKSSRAFLSGSLVDLSTDDAVIFSKTEGSEQGLVLANVRNHPLIVPIAPQLAGRWRDALSGEEFNLGAELTLPPYGRRVLVRIGSG